MFNNLKNTSAFSFVLHALVSLFVGAFAAGLAAAYQGFNANGANVKASLGAGVVAFTAWFLHGFVSLAGTPQAKQAMNELPANIVKFEQTLAGLVESHNTLATLVQQLAEAASSAAPPAQNTVVNVPPAALPMPPNVSIPTQATGSIPWVRP